MPDWDAQVWESLWSPYDEDTYAQVLEHITPSDVVIDIGAGDLRLSRRLANIAAHVYAYERQPKTIAAGIRSGPLPNNLTVVIGDARELPFPTHLTVGVLLMRHCRDVTLYMEKLKRSGARWLFTNARWGLDVERVNLQVPRLPFDAVGIGWYACACGATGFISGPPEYLTEDVLNHVHEVAYCPECHPERILGR